MYQLVLEIYNSDGETVSSKKTETYFETRRAGWLYCLKRGFFYKDADGQWWSMAVKRAV